MRVLHLYSNYKWTGPADLALLLVRGLNVAGGEAVARLALSGWTHPGKSHAIAERAAELGVPTVQGLSLRRHLHVPSLLRDARQLAEWLDERRFDLLHTHQAGDHFTAALAVGLAGRRVPIVRSYWEGRVKPPTPRAAFMFARTSSVLVPFASLADEVAATFALQDRRVHVVEPPLDRSRIMDPDGAAKAGLRSRFGLDNGALLIGITARIQRRRRWDLLWDVLARVRREEPRAHLVVLGRPDEGVFDEVCRAPLERAGLTGHVSFPGYLGGEDYWRVLAGLDLFVFLVPGSDATCRALREAMAVGLPVVCSDSDRLSEIVDEGETGLVRAAEPGAFARAVVELAGDAALRRRLAGAARRHARDRWSAERSAARVRRIYDAALGSR